MTNDEFQQARELKKQISSVETVASMLTHVVEVVCSTTKAPEALTLKDDLTTIISKWEATQLEPLNNKFANL